MIIGIENITVIVKSVVNTSIELPFNERYALGKIIIIIIVIKINILCKNYISFLIWINF